VCESYIELVIVCGRDGLGLWNFFFLGGGRRERQ
jgi:hypothetical protein